jgi:ABC-type Zn uptake system ZnuABC Zn-binding protein ZnuA
MKQHGRIHLRAILALLATLLVLISGCTAPPPDTQPDAASAGTVKLNEGERLRVVTTTNLIADVVAQVGGDYVDSSSLIPIGADPHSFEPRPQDLIELNRAHVIFINGLGLEEGIEPILDSLDGNAIVVAVNEGVETRDMASHGDEDRGHGDDEHADDEHADDEHADDEHAAHQHAEGDPHTWFSVAAVEQWVSNIEQTLSALDPARAADYAANAAAYQTELAELDQELRTMAETLPPERRKLVTDHESFSYLADAYDFEVIGSIVPSLSTLASPSAAQLAALQDQIDAEGVPALFVGTTVNPDMAQQLADDIGIVVAELYTGSLSADDGPAPTYLDFMRHNMSVITDALQ